MPDGLGPPQYALSVFHSPASGEPGPMLDASQTLAGELVSILRNEIYTGRLAPGTRLRQQELARRFHVSTTPVREAFAALQREGLLIASVHRGVIVFRPTKDDLNEIYDMRIALESLATQRGVPLLTDEAIARMAGLLEQMSSGPDEEYGALNDEFHNVIYAAAKRPKIVALINDLRQSSSSYLRLIFASSSNPIHAADTHAGHTAIFEACIARDADAAAAAMADHLRRTVDYVAPMLEDSPA
jgi:DNA-binding GntR family transcriptional regulator